MRHRTAPQQAAVVTVARVQSDYFISGVVPVPPFSGIASQTRRHLGKGAAAAPFTSNS